MSIGEFLVNLPMDKFKMLAGILVAFVGLLVILAGALFAFISPSSIGTAVIIIGAGGSLIAAGVGLVAVQKATSNSIDIKTALDEIRSIKVCTKPETLPTCQYEKVATGLIKE